MTKKFYLNKENLKELNRISLMSKTKENITYIIENIKNILTDEIITKYKSYHSYLENRNHFDEYLQELKEDNNSLKIFQTWIKKIIILERGFLLINLKSMLRKEKQDYKYNNTLEYLELVQLNKSGGYIDIQLETIGIGGGTSIFVKNIQNITLIIDGIQTLKIPKIKMNENYKENAIEYIKSYFLIRKIELTYNYKKNNTYVFKYKELEDSKYNVIKNLISLKSTINDLSFTALKYGVNTNHIEIFYSGHHTSGSYIKSDTAAIKYVADLKIESNREVRYLDYNSSKNDTYRFVIDMKDIKNKIKENNMSSQFHGYNGEIWDLDNFKTMPKNNMSIFYRELKIMKEIEKNDNTDLKLESNIVKYKEEELFEVVEHNEIVRLEVYRQTHKSYKVNSCFRQIASLEKINEVAELVKKNNI